MPVVRSCVLDLSSQIWGRLGVLSLFLLMLDGGRRMKEEATASANKAALDSEVGLLLPNFSLLLAGRGGGGRGEVDGERHAYLLLPSYSLARWSSARRLQRDSLFDAPPVGADNGWGGTCSSEDLLELHQRGNRNNILSWLVAGRGGEGEQGSGAGKVVLFGEDDGLVTPGDSASLPAISKWSPRWVTTIFGQGLGQAGLDGHDGQSIFNLQLGRPFSLYLAFIAAAGPSGAVPGACSGGRNQRRACGRHSRTRSRSCGRL